MGKSPLRLVKKYKNLAINKLFPLATAEVDGLRFRYMRTDSPPQDPKNFATGLEFHHNIADLSGEVAIDIGANIGSYTLPLARRFHDVTAFEPNHTLCRVLRLNVALNHLRNVHVHEVALSDVSGRMPLYIRRGGATSLNATHYGLKYESVSSVRVAMLDEFGWKFDRVDFMKVDAEGLEYRILQGGAHLISTLKPIVAMEVHRAPVYSEGSCSCETCKRLCSLGYKLEVTGESSSVGAVHWVWAVPNSSGSLRQ